MNHRQRRRHARRNPDEGKPTFFFMTPQSAGTWILVAGFVGPAANPTWDRWVAVTVYTVAAAIIVGFFPVIRAISFWRKPPPLRVLDPEKD